MLLYWFAAARGHSLRWKSIQMAGTLLRYRKPLNLFGKYWMIHFDIQEKFSPWSAQWWCMLIYVNRNRRVSVQMCSELWSLTRNPHQCGMCFSCDTWTNSFGIDLTHSFIHTATHVESSFAGQKTAATHSKFVTLNSVWGLKLCLINLASCCFFSCIQR